MNISENILQQVADEAFLPSSKIRLTTSKIFDDWKNQAKDRRAVIQHALDNPALAPFLAGVGEYTDEDLRSAWSAAEKTNALGTQWLRAFLAALPRRESPDLAQAIARAEKAEAERDFERSTADEAIARSDRTYAQICKAARSVGWINMAESGPITTFIRKIGDELATLKSSQLGILRPIAEMPETVPEGFTMVFGSSDSNGVWDISDILSSAVDTDFAILRLPSAEATPPADPEAAAQVPLGPEDCPPGSVFRSNDEPDISFWTVSQVWERGFYLRGECVDWRLAMERMEINTSIPDTGRWDKDAWRPCSKPRK